MAIRSLSVRTTILAALAIIAAISGASILADPASPVTITDVDTPDPVASGGQITHSITIVNTGGAKISNVVMSDQLNGVGGIGVPPQLQIASSRGSCTQSGTLVSCNAGTIEGKSVLVYGALIYARDRRWTDLHTRLAALALVLVALILASRSPSIRGRSVRTVAGST